MAARQLRSVLLHASAVALVVAGVTVAAPFTTPAGAATGVTTPLAVGRNHACALTPTGGVKCWGSNNAGQLGDGTFTDRSTPGDVFGLTSGVTAISAGNDHTCALTSGGGVKCWGQGLNGQLGNGFGTRSEFPVNVSGLTSGVTAIAAGGDAACALTSAGGVKCWGYNGYVQLGDPNQFLDSPIPIDVPSLTSGVIAITVGESNACALTSAGGVKCWGNNANGEVGDGTTVQRTAPVDVTGLTSGVNAISAGGFTACALTSVGGVKCWGDNGNGHVGDGTKTERHTPVNVAGLTSGVTAIADGDSSACALTVAGGVKCWGGNLYAQVGDGTQIDRSTPINVSGLATGVTAIAVGTGNTCALTSAGGVKCLGYDIYGQLGNGTTTKVSLSAVPVVGVASGATAIGAGAIHSCAVTAAGGVKCWGYNLPLQLTDGTLNWQGRALDVPGLASGIKSIGVGQESNCALTTAGGVKCWGPNSFGQVGDGTTTDRSAPTDVSGLASGVIALASGDDHNCALTSAGGVKCWGRNTFGELGDGTTTDRHTPVSVSGLTSGVVAIAAGSLHSCAVTTAGGVKCWGLNDRRQLGDGTSAAQRLTPVNVSGLSSGVAKVAAGRDHTCALTTVGGMKCWGDNDEGQLGDGTQTQRPTPVDVSGLTSAVTGITAAQLNSCATVIGGALRCWGENSSSQLGDGTTNFGLTPAGVPGLQSAVAAVAIGTQNICALIPSGVKCLGDNEQGQLGDGDPTGLPVDATGSFLMKPLLASASDSFTRTLANGWGIADVGGPWTVAAPANRYQVNGTGATMTAPTAASGGDASVLPNSLVDADMRVRISADKAATGNGQWGALVARRVSAGQFRIRLHVLANGTLGLSLSRVLSGVETLVGPEVVVPALTFIPNTFYNLHAQVTGANPTMIVARVWPDGQSEPSTWPLSRTDNTAALQGAGAPGLWSYVSSTSSNAPVVFTFDNFSVQLAGPLLASDAFGRTVASGWSSADVGGAYAYKAGEQPSLSVAGGVGTLVVPTAGTSRQTWLPAVSVRDVDGVVSIAANKAATGSFGFSEELQLRRVATNTSYAARLRVASDGSVHLAATKLIGSATETLIGAEVLAAGVTATPGVALRMRAEATGASPTTIQVRVWKASDPEPVSWQLVRTDSEASLQVAGAVGVFAYLGGSTTNAPVTFTFDNLEIRGA